MLGEVSRSEMLLRELAPIGEMQDERSRMRRIKSLNSLYGLGKVGAADLTFGVTYGLERSAACLPLK